MKKTSKNSMKAEKKKSEKSTSSNNKEVAVMNESIESIFKKFSPTTRKVAIVILFSVIVFSLTLAVASQIDFSDTKDDRSNRVTGLAVSNEEEDEEPSDKEDKIPNEDIKEAFYELFPMKTNDEKVSLYELSDSSLDFDYAMDNRESSLYKVVTWNDTISTIKERKDHLLITLKYGYNKFITVEYYGDEQYSVNDYIWVTGMITDINTPVAYGEEKITIKSAVIDEERPVETREEANKVYKVDKEIVYDMFLVKIDKIEYADTEVRVWISVDNNSDDIVYWYGTTATIVQDQVQYENFSSEGVSDFPGSFYPDVSYSGYLIFPVVDENKPMKIYFSSPCPENTSYFDGSSDCESNEVVFDISSK